MCDAVLPLQVNTLIPKRELPWSWHQNDGTPAPFYHPARGWRHFVSSAVTSEDPSVPPYILISVFTFYLGSLVWVLISYTLYYNTFFLIICHHGSPDWPERWDIHFVNRIINSAVSCWTSACQLVLSFGVSFPLGLPQDVGRQEGESS